MTKKIRMKEIKRKMAKHYTGHYKQNMERKMHITPINNDHQHLGMIVFSLDGSPPKGWAVYTPRLSKLSIYDAWGKRWRKMRTTVVDEFGNDLYNPTTGLQCIREL